MSAWAPGNEQQFLVNQGTLKIHEGSVNKILLKGDKLVSVSSDCSVRVWDTPSFNQIFVKTFEIVNILIKLI
jgi:WD40 repeat protein